MAYIGRSPLVGNFVKLDSITVVNGQAAYTMNNGGSAFTDYDNANQFLVSLNGVLQAPGDSFTVSGSTLTFASNLATGDVIDFVIVLGNTLDLGTPSDNTVTNAKTNFVSTSSAAGLQIKGDGTTAGALQLNCEQNSHGIKLQSPAHSANQSYTLKFPTGNVTADKVLKVASVSGSGTTGVGQLSFGDAGGGMFEFISSTDVTSDASQVDFTSFSTDYSDFKLVIQNLHGSSDGVETYMRFFGSDGNIKSGGSDYSWTFGYSSGDSQSDNDSNIRLGRPVGNAGVESSHYEITIFDVHDTGDTAITQGYKHAMFQQSASLNDGTIVYAIGGGWGKGEVSSNYSITGVRIYLQAGNIASGRFSLYGRKHS